MRRALRVNAALLQAVCELGELRGRVRGDARLRGLGVEQLGIGKYRAENFQGRQRTSSGGRGGEQIIKREAVHQRARAREVGMNLKSLLIARHQQWRVL